MSPRCLCGIAPSVRPTCPSSATHAAISLGGASLRRDHVEASHDGATCKCDPTRRSAARRYDPLAASKARCTSPGMRPRSETVQPCSRAQDRTSRAVAGRAGAGFAGRHRRQRLGRGCVHPQLRTGSGEESIGPLLGELTVLGKDDRDRREARVALRDRVRDDRGTYVLEGEDLRVPVLDDNSRPRQVAELGERIGELPAREARAEVRETLALHGSDDPITVGDGVVAAGQPLRSVTTCWCVKRQGYRSWLSTRISSSATPCALAVGRSTLGRACLVVRADCQKIAGRPPRTRVMTNWERLSLRRSRTRSMAAPREVHERVGMRSTMSASRGHSSVRWQ